MKSLPVDLDALSPAAWLAVMLSMREETEEEKADPHNKRPKPRPYWETVPDADLWQLIAREAERRYKLAPHEPLSAHLTTIQAQLKLRVFRPFLHVCVACGAQTKIKGP